MIRQLGTYWVRGFVGGLRSTSLNETRVVTAYSLSDAIEQAKRGQEFYETCAGVFDVSVFSRVCSEHPAQVCDIVADGTLYSHGDQLTPPYDANPGFGVVKAWCAAGQHWDHFNPDADLVRRAAIGVGQLAY